MAVSSTKALTRNDKGLLMFNDTAAFSDEERDQIQAAMKTNPQAYEVFEQEAKDAGQAQVMIRYIDNEIKDLQKKLRESPEFKLLQKKRSERKRFLANINDSIKRAEGALLTVLKGVRKGSARFDQLKAFHNTLQLGKGGE